MQLKCCSSESCSLMLLYIHRADHSYNTLLLIRFVLAFFKTSNITQQSRLDLSALNNEHQKKPISFKVPQPWNQSLGWWRTCVLISHVSFLLKITIIAKGWSHFSLLLVCRCDKMSSYDSFLFWFSHPSYSLNSYLNQSHFFTIKLTEVVLSLLQERSQKGGIWNPCSLTDHSSWLSQSMWCKKMCN